MCMKNVNINSFICEKIIGREDGISFVGLSDKLYGVSSQEGITINSFGIAVLVNIIQSRDEDELTTNYECSMRITSFEGKTTEVTRFKVNENIQIYEKQEGVVCRNFATNKFFIQLENYTFPSGEGRYILKILIRKKDDISNAVIENDTQFMMPIFVLPIESKYLNESSNS